MAGKNFKKDITGDVTADFLSIGRPATADDTSGSPAEDKTDGKEEARTEPKKKTAATTKAKRKTTTKKAAGKPVKKEPAPETANAQGIPAGFTLKKEPKTDRLQLLVSPRIKEKLKGRAKADGVSVNELVNSFIEKGLRED